MFDFVHRRKRVVQVIMVIAVLPFLFWGLESYQNEDGEDYIAIVSGEKIHRQEFDQSLRNRYLAMRDAMGDSFDISMLDDPRVRASVLEELIQTRLLNQEAARLRFAITDSQLVSALQSVPQFQQDNEFSNQLYRELLRDQGMEVVTFETNIRQEMMRNQVIDGYLKNGFISNTVAKNIMRLSGEKREISSVHIEPDQFISKMKPSNDEIKEYYGNHQADFKQSEEVQIEYLVLSVDDLAKNIQVSSEEIKGYFDEHKAEFGQMEERQASHILLSAPATASDADKEAARSKAEELLLQIKQAPQDFAKFAKEHSQDAGSSDKGGDLGFFGRDTMDKAFEDEVFQMEPEEIRGPIQTGFGFHIIKLSAIKNGENINFDEVKDEVEKKLRKQKSSKDFGEKAEEFRNIVYEENESFQLAAETLKLSIQKSDWISRTGGKEPYFTNVKLLQIIFSEDSINNRNNSEVIEITQDTLISARVLKHKPAAMLSIAEVKEKIFEILASQKASDQAVKNGKEKLEKLQKGEKDIVKWDPNQTVARNDPKDLEEDVLRAVFKAKPFSFPAYVGVINSQGGFSLVRISNVIKTELPDEEKIKIFGKQLQQQVYAQEELSSYLSAVKQRSDLTVMKDRIEIKE
ncbi:MAG: SurA N-terminal domain-containing protein [Burkholderiales bacterium]